jgi:hypothetical protein
VCEAVRFYLLEAYKRAPRAPAARASTTPPARACVGRAEPSTDRPPFPSRSGGDLSSHARTALPSTLLQSPVPTNARARDEGQGQAAWGPRGCELRGVDPAFGCCWLPPGATRHGVAARASAQQARVPGSQQQQAPSPHVHGTFPLHCKHDCRKLTRNIGDVPPTLKGSIVSR